MSSYIDPYLLSLMRQAAEDSMVSVAQVRQKGSPTRTPAGGSSFTWATTGTYSCRVVPVQRLPREESQGGQVTAIALWSVLLPWNAVVQPENRIWVDGGPIAGGYEFEVTSVDDAQSESIMQQAQCKKLN